MANGNKTRQTKVGDFIEQNRLSKHQRVLRQVCKDRQGGTVQALVVSIISTHSR